MTGLNLAPPINPIMYPRSPGQLVTWVICKDGVRSRTTGNSKPFTGRGRQSVIKYFTLLGLAWPGGWRQQQVKNGSLLGWEGTKGEECDMFVLCWYWPRQGGDSDQTQTLSVRPSCRMLLFWKMFLPHSALSPPDCLRISQPLCSGLSQTFLQPVSQSASQWKMTNCPKCCSHILLCRYELYILWVYRITHLTDCWQNILNRCKNWNV